MLKREIRSFIIVIMVWYTFSILAGNNIVPYPHELLKRLIEYPNVMLPHIGASLYRLLMGIFLAVTLGTYIGIKLGLSQKLDHLFSPLVNAFHPIPKSALTPVFIMLFGIGDLSRVLIVSTIAIFPIIVNVQQAIKNIDDNYFYAVENMKLTTKQFYFDFIIPTILPTLLSTTKITIATGTAVLYISENIGASKGLGYYIGANSATDNINMFLGIFFLSVIGYVLIRTLEVLYDKYCFWAK